MCDNESGLTVLHLSPKCCFPGVYTVYNLNVENLMIYFFAGMLSVHHGKICGGEDVQADQAKQRERIDVKLHPQIDSSTGHHESDEDASNNTSLGGE